MPKVASNRQAILELFYKDPYQTLHMRQIGRLLNKEPGVFQRAINALVKEGILKSEYRANARFFSLCQEHRCSFCSECDLNMLVHNTTDRICARDKEGALLAWNKAFADSIEKIFGIKPYVGLKTWELIPATQQTKLQSVREAYRKVHSGEKIIVRYAYPMPDGEIRQLETSWVPLRKNGEIYASGEVTRDITQRIKKNKRGKQRR
jgi:PAS domain S-box-containing protein